MSPCIMCLQDVPSDSPSFCFLCYGIGCSSETNCHSFLILPSSLQILRLSIPSSWNTALFLSKNLPASLSQERTSGLSCSVSSWGRLLTPDSVGCSPVIQAEQRSPAFAPSLVSPPHSRSGEPILCGLL